jgi:hypothetical protein
MLLYYLYMTYDQYRIKKKYISTIGKVKDSICKSYDKYFDCSLNIIYKIENKEYQNKLKTYNNTNYKPDDSINIKYNKQNENKIILDEEEKVYTTWIIISIILVIVSVFNLSYMKRIYKKNFNQ